MRLVSNFGTNKEASPDAERIMRNGRSESSYEDEMLAIYAVDADGSAMKASIPAELRVDESVCWRVRNSAAVIGGTERRDTWFLRDDHAHRWRLTVVPGEYLVLNNTQINVAMVIATVDKRINTAWPIQDTLFARNSDFIARYGSRGSSRTAFSGAILLKVGRWTRLP